MMATTKKELRKAMVKVVTSLTSTERHRQSDVVFKKLIEHPKYMKARSISIYLSTDREINTEPILRHSLEVSRKQCFIPVIEHTMSSVESTGSNQQPTRMLMVELNSMKELEEMPLNRYGIKEPKIADIASSKIANPIMTDLQLDLILVPGVAFSKDGRRLGHGKGYYDEYLSDWQRRSLKGALYSIGLAFDEQIVDDPLAVGGQDYKLDEVIASCR